MRAGPGASWKQEWGSMEMRAVAGRIPLLVTDMPRLALLPCKTCMVNNQPWSHEETRNDYANA